MKHEQLSALLDGELDELATARLLKALDEEAGWTDDWETYTLIGDALREGDQVAVAGRAGARRALDEIAREPAPRRTLRLPRMSRHWMPWAIAASAALVAFQLASLAPAGTTWTASAGTVRQVAHAMLATAGLGEADVQAADPAEMDRFIDLHREVATPGFQRTSLEAADLQGGVGGR